MSRSNYLIRQDYLITNVKRKKKRKINTNNFWYNNIGQDAEMKDERTQKKNEVEKKYLLLIFHTNHFKCFGGVDK